MLNLQLTELSAVGTEYTQNLPLGTIIGSRIKIFGCADAPSIFISALAQKYSIGLRPAR